MTHIICEYWWLILFFLVFVGVCLYGLGLQHGRKEKTKPPDPPQNILGD